MARIIQIEKRYQIIRNDRNNREFENGIEFVKYLRRVENNNEAFIFTSFQTIDTTLNYPNSALEMLNRQSVCISIN